MGISLKPRLLLLVALALVSTGILACSSDPETVEVIKEVEVEKIVEVEVEVEKEVEVI